MINFINEKILLSIQDYYKGYNIKNDLAFLMKSETWTLDRLEKYQNKKLQRLIDHVYCNVPFYKNIFDENGITPSDIETKEDLKKLPILNKNDIRKGFKDGSLFSKNFNKNELILNSSSGSTGEPLQFYLTKKADSFKKATAIRGWYWMNYRLGDKILRVSPIPRGGTIKKIQDNVTRTNYFYTPQLTTDVIQSLVEEMINFKPKVLRIYPDPLNYLSEYLNQKKVEIKFIKSINTTGSTLLPETRLKAEKLFNCKVYDSFSCEGGAVVFEKPEDGCYYSAMEYAITEVLDQNGDDTNKGRLVTTDLWNYATPFIRYDTQDIVELSETSHPLSLKAIKKIHGRQSDVLVTAKGQLLYVNNFTGIFQWIEEVEQFQIHQIEKNKFVLNLITNDKYNV